MTAVILNQDTSGAAEETLPSPLLLFPKDMRTPALVIRHDRGHRHVLRDVKHRSKWYGHVSLTLFGPDPNRQAYHIALASKNYVERLNAPAIAKSIPTAPGFRDNARHLIAAMQETKRNLTERSRGIIQDEKDRYHDALRIHSITEASWHDACDVITKYTDTPPDYRAIGWKQADNCVTLCTRVMRAAEVPIPAIWNAFPWPFTVGMTIEIMAAVERLTGMRKDASVINVPGREIQQLFRRAHANRLNNYPDPV